MKNIVIAAMLAALGSTCLAETNTSQVSVYGRFDAGIDYLHGVRAADGRPASRWAAQSGDWGASWLGFKGRDDLGGGDAIVFALETGLNLMKGAVTGSAASGNAFSRVATVGLQSQRYGTLRLGRDLLLSNGQWDMDPMMNELSSGNTLMRSRNALIANNLLQYQSAPSHGVDLLLQYALGEAHDRAIAADGQAGRAFGLQLSYAAPGYLVRGQWNTLDDAHGKLSNIFVASRELFLGAAVDVSEQLKLQAAINRLHAPDTAPGLADRAAQWRIGGQYRLDRQWQLTAGLYRMDVHGGAGDASHDGAGHATLLAVGALYYFSPVTFAYLSAAHVRNGAGAMFGVGSNSPGSDSLANPLPGHAQAGTYLGIVTAF